MIGINQKLSEDWHKLTPAEKEAFKPSSTAAQIAPTAPTVPAPTVPAEVGKGQMTILKCNSCGRMFFNQDALDNHKRWIVLKWLEVGSQKLPLLKHQILLKRLQMRS